MTTTSVEGNYLDAAAADIHESEGFERSDADCLAAAMVDAVGVDELNAAGIGAEEFAASDGLDALELDLSQATADEMATGMGACTIDLSNLIVDEFERQLPGFELSTESVSCLAEQTAGDVFGPAFATAAIEGGDQAEKLGEQLGVDALGMCPEAITEMFLVALEGEGLELTADAEVCLTSEIQKRGPSAADPLRQRVPPARTLPDDDDVDTPTLLCGRRRRQIRPTGPSTRRWETLVANGIGAASPQFVGDHRRPVGFAAAVAVLRCGAERQHRAIHTSG